VSQDTVMQLIENPAPSSEKLSSQTTDFTNQFHSFFGFKEVPFNNTPDPNFFYTSKPHQEALMSMLFGVEQRKGFVVLTGEIGAGKSTLCRKFIVQVPGGIKTAVILNPNLSGTHLLASIVRDFGIECKGKTKRHYFDALNRFLIEGLDQNRNACLIVDEAQCLSVRVLEEIRLLCNLETSKRKLLQIILMGQPELRDLLKRPQLTQLRQRVGVYVHLRGLDPEETREYILHRLAHSTGGNSEIELDSIVIEKIHETTRGIPRLINALCDRIMMSAFSANTRHITWEVSRNAFEEMAFICQA